jgi:hemerythrin-like domain-containing protein
MITHEPPPAGGEDGAIGGPGSLLVEAVPPALLDEPLAYIFADHFRQRQVCAALRRIAQQGWADRAEADSVVEFLTYDLPLHHGDEDKDLFPAVRRRALPEDRLGAILARLAEDHRRAGPLIDRIVSALSLQPGDATIPVDAATREAIQTYVAGESAHVAMENGIVLAIARIRLGKSDLKIMTHGMKARRGLVS